MEILDLLFLFLVVGSIGGGGGRNLLERLVVEIVGNADPLIQAARDAVEQAADEISRSSKNITQSFGQVAERAGSEFEKNLSASIQKALVQLRSREFGGTGQSLITGKFATEEQIQSEARQVADVLASQLTQQYNQLFGGLGEEAGKTFSQQFRDQVQRNLGRGQEGIFGIAGRDIRSARDQLLQGGERQSSVFGIPDTQVRQVGDVSQRIVDRLTSDGTQAGQNFSDRFVSATRQTLFRFTSELTQRFGIQGAEWANAASQAFQQRFQAAGGGIRGAISGTIGALGELRQGGAFGAIFSNIASTVSGPFVSAFNNARGAISSFLGPIQNLFALLGPAAGPLAALGGTALALQQFVQQIREATQEALRFSQIQFGFVTSIRAAQRVYGSAAGSIAFWREEVERLREEYRIFSRQDLTEATARIIRFTREIGFTADQNQDVLRGVIALAAASGVEIETAAGRVANALVGQRRGLELLGIDMAQMEITQEAFRLGIAETTRRLTVQENALATLSLFMQKVDPLVEDAAAAQDTLQGRVAAANARIEESQEIIGRVTAVITVAYKEAVAEITQELATWIETNNETVASVIGLGAAVSEFVNQLREIGGPSGAGAEAGDRTAQWIADNLGVDPRRVGQFFDQIQVEVDEHNRSIESGQFGAQAPQKTGQEALAEFFGFDVDAVGLAFQDAREDALRDISGELGGLGDIQGPTIDRTPFSQELEQLVDTAIDTGFELQSIQQGLSDQLADLAASAGEQLAAAEQSAQDRRVEAAQSAQERLIAAEQSFQERRADIIAGFQSSMADLEANFAERRQSILESAGRAAAQAAANHARQLERLEEDHQRRMRDIRERFGRTIDEAVQRRDARAILNAQRERQDALEKEEEEFEIRRKRLKEDFAAQQAARAAATAAQLRALDRQEAKQREKLRERRDEQLADLEESYDDQRQEIREQYAEQIADINEQLAKQRAEINKNYAKQRQEALDAFDERLIGIARSLGQENKVTAEGAEQIFQTYKKYFDLDSGQVSRLLRAFQEERFLRQAIETEIIQQSITTPAPVGPPGAPGPIDASQIQAQLESAAEEVQSGLNTQKQIIDTGMAEQEEAVQFSYIEREREMEDSHRRQKSEITTSQDTQKRELQTGLNEQETVQQQSYSDQLGSASEYANDRLNLFDQLYTTEQELTNTHMQAIFEILNAYFGSDGVILRMMNSFREQMSTQFDIEVDINTQQRSSGGAGGFGGPSFAQGGAMVASSPTLVQFGEAGRELAVFVPLSGGTSQMGGLSRRRVDLFINGRLRVQGMNPGDREFEDAVATVLNDAIIESGIIQGVSR